jgi:hypothetical protein
MNQLSVQKRCEIIAAHVEGNSLRATCPMTGAAMNTVLKLLADLGEACALLSRPGLAESALPAPADSNRG